MKCVLPSTENCKATELEETKTTTYGLTLDNSHILGRGPWKTSLAYRDFWISSKCLSLFNENWVKKGSKNSSYRKKFFKGPRTRCSNYRVVRVIESQMYAQIASNNNNNS